MSAFTMAAAAPVVAVVPARQSRATAGAARSALRRPSMPAAPIRRTIRTMAAAEASAEAPAADSAAPKKFFFCIANAEFMLHDENNEHFPEVLRERRRFYRETSKAQDFWIVPNPAFLDAMPDVKAKIRQPCVAIVTTDKVWNDFMKLRLDRVYKGGVEGTAAECLASTTMIPLDAFKDTVAPKWAAPYNKYAPGWWEAFYPGNEDK